MSITSNFDSAALMASIEKQAMNIAEERVREYASTLENFLKREIANDYQFGGGKYGKELTNRIAIAIEQTSNMTFSLKLDMSGLSDNQKETLEFYMENAKSYTFAA